MVAQLQEHLLDEEPSLPIVEGEGVGTTACVLRGCKAAVREGRPGEGDCQDCSPRVHGAGGRSYCEIVVSTMAAQLQEHLLDEESSLPIVGRRGVGTTACVLRGCKVQQMKFLCIQGCKGRPGEGDCQDCDPCVHGTGGTGQLRERPPVAALALYDSEQVHHTISDLKFGRSLKLPCGTQIQGVTMVIVKPLAGDSRCVVENIEVGSV